MIKKFEDICKEEYDKGYKDCFFDGIFVFALIFVARIVLSGFWRI
jgi:hypothetical protein